MIDQASLKEKIIVVADLDERQGQQISSTLIAQGYADVRCANSIDKIYEILRRFYDQPEKLGLIVCNGNLQRDKLIGMCNNLSNVTDASIIPFVIFENAYAGANTIDDTESVNWPDHWFVQKINLPVQPQELLLAVNLLLKLKEERLVRAKQEDQLIDQIASLRVEDSKLKYLAFHDELTGLFNRSNFERQLKLALIQCNKQQKEGALVFFDVDRFCLLNELEGIDVGDRLLVELTILVRKLVPSKSLFARVGGDQFCLFLENMNKKQVQQHAETLKTAVENFKFYSEEVRYSATISVGIATLDDGVPVSHPGELIMHARQACNFAKLNGRDRIVIYNSEDTHVRDRRRDIYWLPIIRKALKANDLFLVFQPVVQLDNGNISHYEVLVRMRDENGTAISPNIFIPVAERTGVIHAIDLWVIEKAIDFLAALPAPRSYVSIAINLSAVAFQNHDLLEVIREKLELSWVDASRLTFEITETAAVNNFEMTREMINKIHSLGCKFALDDFGSGFCSFNYLKELPVDYVKIDGQFIRNLVTNETDQILVKSMIDIARKLGKKTIAEFVESTDSLEILSELGVDFGQGYIFGKPECELLQGPSIPLYRMQKPIHEIHN